MHNAFCKLIKFKININVNKMIKAIGTILVYDNI